MSYRNELIERTRAFESQNSEPAVLDYLQLRNRQCLYAWQLRRAQYELSTQRARTLRGAEPHSDVA
jgi:hypothetical protein